MRHLANLQSASGNHSDQPIVLVVEGNLDDHLVLHYLLRQQIKGVLPVGATSGQQALTYMDNCYAQQHTVPVLIFLDLYLPHRKDGWKLLRKIRSHPIYRSIPVVMVSSSMEDTDIEQSYQWGANSYIKKPSTLEGWKEVVPVLPQLMRC